MDDDLSYAADIANSDDNRTIHRNSTDGYIDSGADVNIYPKDFGRVLVHNITISVDEPENVSDDTRDFRSARTIYTIAFHHAGA